MTEQLQAMQQQIVAAVQQQLTKYSEQVSAEVQRLRDEIAAERAGRDELDTQVRALAAGLEKSHQANGDFQGELQRALEQRLGDFGTATERRHDEINARLDRVVEEANVGVAAAVESATRPMMRAVEDRQDKVETDVKSLDKSLRKFDKQAARMVAHINEVTTSVDSRIEQSAAAVTAEVERHMSTMTGRVDDVAAQIARKEADVESVVGQRVEDAELRMNDKIAAAESRIGETVGTRIADIDAYVGRISVGLDEGIVVLNDRIGELQADLDSSGEQIAAMEKSIKEVDLEAIDEMKEKVSSAAGEAMLVRIEMERFQTSMGEALDKNSVRLTELETQVQDQALDTEAAVQLERLEEVERALIMLDPSQFVRVDGAPAIDTYHASDGIEDTTSVGADEGGVDIDLTMDLNLDDAMAPPSSPLTPPTGHNPTESTPSLAPPADATASSD